MRYLKLFENFQDIDSLCKEYGIGNYTINDDRFVDVDGDVVLKNKLREVTTRKIPIKFGKVRGDFDCSFNRLTSLEGCPKEVGNGFSCYCNELTSLKGCPKEVGGDFNCSDNELTSLKGCPENIFFNFLCYDNHLSSLEGCPKEVGGVFNCSGNYLTSLKGCPNINRDFYCKENRITVIDYLPEFIEGKIDFSFNKIRDIKVEDKSYRFFGKCNLEGNPINSLFKYWEGNLREFIEEIEFEDFIRDEGKSVDMLRFEYALNGKKYNKDSIEINYKLIWKK